MSDRRPQDQAGSRPAALPAWRSDQEAAPQAALEPYLSIVVPVFNEQESLPELIQRLAKVAGGLGRPYEVVFVNDGSQDRSGEILSASVAADAHLVVVDLNRNYGQHPALLAGFTIARGEIIVTLDADMQNPPEEIPKLVARMEEGFDVVGSVRVDRQDTLFRRVASRLVNRVTSMATGVKLHDYGCMLRAYHRSVVRALCDSQEISTFIPVLADMLAGRVTEIPVAHAERTRGASKYSLLKLVRLQFDLLTSFTLLPLRLTMGLGIVTSVLSFVAALVLVVGRLTRGPEWAASGVFTLFAGVFFFIGMVLLALGLLGEYVGRMYLEVRRRPRYVIRRVLRDGEQQRESP